MMIYSNSFSIRFTCPDEPELVTAGANVVRVFRMRPSERASTEAEANKLLRENTPPKVKLIRNTCDSRSTLNNTMPIPPLLPPKIIL